MLTMYTIDLENLWNDPLSRGMDPQSTFRVSDFTPSSVSSRDIVRCLTMAVPTQQNNNNNNGGAGGGRIHFEIVWVNDSTFMVAVRDSHHSRLVLDSLRRQFGPIARISTLQQHMQLTQRRRRQQQLQQGGSMLLLGQQNQLEQEFQHPPQDRPVGWWNAFWGFWGWNNDDNRRKRRRIE